MDFEEYANRRVLIVDDQREIHDDFAEMLKPRLSEAWADNLAAAFVAEEEQSFLPEFELLHARSGEEAFEIVSAGKERNDPVAVAYIDIRMPPGIDGIETIRRVREVDRDVEIVLMTAYTDRTLPEIIQNVEPLHKVLYIRKPFAREEIQQITLSLVGKWNIEQALAEKRRQLAVNHKRLEAVLDATGEAMAMYDLTGRLLFANQGYERLTDLTESELRKLSPDALTAQLEERFREPDLHDVKARFVFKDGGDLLEESAEGKVPEQRLFYRSTAPVRDGQGEVMGSLFVYRDVSNTPRDALTRLENMLLMGAVDMPLTAIRQQVASSVDVVLQVARLRSGRRCVTSITDVVGLEKDVVITEEMWRFNGDGFEGSGRQPSWMEAVDRAGLRGELLEVLQMGNNDAEARR